MSILLCCSYRVQDEIQLENSARLWEEAVIAYQGSIRIFLERMRKAKKTSIRISTQQDLQLIPFECGRGISPQYPLAMLIHIYITHSIITKTDKVKQTFTSCLYFSNLKFGFCFQQLFSILLVKNFCILQLFFQFRCKRVSSIL